MHKVNTNNMPELSWSSPKGKFVGAGKQVSEALGRKPFSTDLKERHPFDIEICRVPPGKTPYSYHSHSAQWEFYHVISGKGAVRHKDGTTPIEPGDAFIFQPDEPHQLINDGSEDLILYVVADNPIGESSYSRQQEMAGALARTRDYPLRESGLLRWGRMKASDELSPRARDLNRGVKVMVLALLAILAWSLPVEAQGSKDATPFGPIGEVDVDQLMKFGKARGFDLQPEMQRIYKKDEEALARLFALSLKFKTFDRNARTYGSIMYTCWLRFGEAYGVDLYLKVLDRQPDEVQQRVRDFLYYPLLRMPKEKRKENVEEMRRMYPRLFPIDFQFGRNDPIF